MNAFAKLKRKNPDAMKGVLKAVQDAAKKEIAVGFPKGKANAYPDGTPVALVAACHVYGMGVPVRDFMALAKPDIIRRTKKALGLLKKGGLNSVQIEIAQNAAGVEAEAAIKKGITDMNSPPLAPATIKAKGSSKPLIDTEHMRDSVTYVIRDRTR